jgi:hypothetical protein
MFPYLVTLVVAWVCVAVLIVGLAVAAARGDRQLTSAPRHLHRRWRPPVHTFGAPRRPRYVSRSHTLRRPF